MYKFQKTVDKIYSKCYNEQKGLSLNKEEGFEMISAKNKRIISVVIVILNIMVYFSTVYKLIYNAQSQTYQDCTVCGHDEHIHTASCYTSYADNYEGQILKCEIAGVNDNISHKHDDFCYDSENHLICPLEEYEHIHSQSCFNENNEQICGIIVHQHTEQCFCSSESVENMEDYKLLVCNREAHTHRDECFGLHAP